MYTIVYTKTAAKQIALLKSANIDKRAKKLIDPIEKNPSQIAIATCNSSQKSNDL